VTPDQALAAFARGLMQACLDAGTSGAGPSGTTPAAKPTRRSRRRPSAATAPRHVGPPQPTPELAEPIVDPLTLFDGVGVPETLGAIIKAEVAKQQISDEEREKMERVLRGEGTPAAGHYSPEDSESKPWLSS
jgi:hypothetical protein